MDVRWRVGLNVRRFRRELELSQEAFAFQAGLHRTYISGIERGICNPTILVLETIATALGVPSARLIEDLPDKRTVDERQSPLTD